MESGMLLRTNVYAVYATRETKDTATIRALDEVPSAKTFVSLSKFNAPIGTHTRTVWAINGLVCCFELLVYREGKGKEMSMDHLCMAYKSA